MQRFTGQIVDENGKNLSGVNVILNGETTDKETIIKKVITNKNGFYNILIPNNIDSSKTSLTYSKEGRTLKSIKNPQPTSTYTPLEEPKIDEIYGGKLNLNNSFDSGKYLISSLKTQDRDILDFELYNVKEFIKNNPGNYNITIKASESRVPNNDREEFLEDGSPNPNWAGPEGEFRPEGRLGPKILSQKRFNSLKKYIEDAFKEEGIPTPIIKSEIIISGPDYDPNNKTENYKQYQYTNLNVSLLQVNCKTREVNRGQKFEGDKTLYKPPGATKITLNAFNIPDRFGINGVYKEYYTQNTSALGSQLTWEFIVYLSIYKTSNQNDETIKKSLVLKSDIRKALLSDFIIEPTTKIEIIGFIKKQIASKFGLEEANKYDNKSKTDKEIIDLLFEYVDPNIVDYTYKLPIKRENTVISLTNVGESFILNQRKGSIASPSVYSFNICN